MADGEADSGARIVDGEGRAVDGEGVCAVCRRSVALTKAGQVRVHGPIGNRCL